MKTTGFGTSLSDFFSTALRARGDFPPFGLELFRDVAIDMLKVVAPFMLRMAQGSVTQNAGTNITVADPGFTPKFVIAYNVTEGKCVLWFSSLGAGKGVDLYGAGAAIAANGVTVSTADVTTFGSEIGANASVFHYVLFGN